MKFPWERFPAGSVEKPVENVNKAVHKPSKFGFPEIFNVEKVENSELFDEKRRKRTVKLQETVHRL